MQYLSLFYLLKNYWWLLFHFYWKTEKNEPGLLTARIFLRFTKNWSKEIPVIDSVLKTNLLKYKIKELNGGENREVSWKRIAVEQIINKLLFRNRFHIRDKVKVVLDLTNFA